MTNPIAQIRKTCQSVKHEDGTYGPETEDLYTSVQVWCPGCKQGHQFRVEVHQPDFKRQDGSDQPTWEWNGSLTNPTFSPSLLCYSTVHVCEGQHTYTACYGNLGTEPDECGHSSHGYFWALPDGSQRVYKTWETIPEGAIRHFFSESSPHTADPAFGNCHSFLKDSTWQFLDDCAHSLRGFVPLEPLPDWLVRD